MINNLIEKIKIPSEADPDKPEFPPDNPHFPATPTFRIQVAGFGNVWIKDESINKYSGTHKDRLAWEVVVLYRDLLIAQKNGRLKKPLPQFSIISSGSAALAIGRMLCAYGLPKLKVLVDDNLDLGIQQAIATSHCEIFKADLCKKELNPQEILKLTCNPDGFDLTSNRGISLDIGNFDWMSYEIINESPSFVFLPFGSGFVFTKLMEIVKNTVRTPDGDKRYRGDISTLPFCNFMGASTLNSASIADKLYSPFLPFAKINEDWMRFYRAAAFCGERTGIYPVEEKFFTRAMNIAIEQNISCEPSGIAGLALLLQMQDSLPKDQKILIVNTGRLKLEN